MNYSEICGRSEEARLHHLHSYIWFIYTIRYLQNYQLSYLTLENTSLILIYRDITIAVKGHKILAYTCILYTHSLWAWKELHHATSAVKQSRFLSSRPKHPYIIVTLNNKPLGTEHLSNPDSNGHMGREHTCICYD